MDDVLRRLKRAINWLIFQEVAENETELAEKLGYRKSSFSQIVNGKVPLAEKFINRLCSLDENINGVWILTGEGDLLISGENNNPNGQNGVFVPENVWSVIQAQAQSLSARDKQIDDLISLLKSQLAEKRKNSCPTGRRCNLCRCRIIGFGNFQRIIPKY